MKSVSVTETSIEKFKAAALWRLLYRLVPFGFNFHPLLAMFRPEGSFIKIPWGGHYLVLLSEWLVRPTSAISPLYLGPWIQNPEFFEILKPKLPGISNGFIVDIGANIGAYTLNFKDCCSNPIIAFEPDPQIFNILQLSIRESGLENVTLENVACGRIKGTLDFLWGMNGSVSPDSVQGLREGADSCVKVPVVTIDERFTSNEKISVIKIDCEGYEVNILEGALNVLRNQRPLLFIEVHPSMLKNFNNSPEEILDILGPIYDLQFWKLKESKNSQSRLNRFFSRYRRGVERLRDREEFLSLANGLNPPEQMFVLAVARNTMN
jgi:FkbM family methyltransferase